MGSNCTSREQGHNEIERGVCGEPKSLRFLASRGRDLDQYEYGELYKVDREGGEMGWVY